MLTSNDLEIDWKLPERSCGECHACCEVLGVQDLAKPFWARCRHLDPDGGCKSCTIYGNHPGNCKTYQCAWRQGMLADTERPDLVSCLFDPTPFALYACFTAVPIDMNRAIKWVLQKTADWQFDKCIIMLPGQQVVTDFKTPDYECPDSADGPYQATQIHTDLHGRTYWIQRGPWRDLLMPLQK